MGTHLWTISLMFSDWPSSGNCSDLFLSGLQGLWLSLCRRVLSMAFPYNPKGHPAGFWQGCTGPISHPRQFDWRSQGSRVREPLFFTTATSLMPLQCACVKISAAKQAAQIWYNLHFGRRSSADQQKTACLMQQIYEPDEPPRRGGWRRICTWWSCGTMTSRLERQPYHFSQVRGAK